MDRFKALMDERSKDDDLLPIGDFDLVFSTTETQAFRNALELVMRDFGQDEFFTRTGFDLAEGAQMIDKLNAALIAPLHIEHRGNGSAHSQVAQSR